MTRIATLFACLGLLVSACGEESTSEPAPAPDPEPATAETGETDDTAAENPDVPDPSPAGEVMRGHFGRAADARDALIRGDLPPAQADMRWLATHEGGGTLEANLRPLFDAMQTEAGRFAEASTLTEAGTALARTLTQCGACHTTANAGPEIATPPLPEGDTVAAHMRRHRWAADRMWEGLVTNDADRYQAGAAALREASLFEAEIEAEAEAEAPPERVRAIANLVHELGDRAAAAPDPAERAVVYGRLLATCATCHRMLEVGDTVAASEAAPDGLPTEAE